MQLGGRGRAYGAPWCFDPDLDLAIVPGLAVDALPVRAPSRTAPRWLPLASRAVASSPSARRGSAAASLLPVRTSTAAQGARECTDPRRGASGNSGALLTNDGAVAGTVFATSTLGGTGYVLTDQATEALLDDAAGFSAKVSSQVRPALSAALAAAARLLVSMAAWQSPTASSGPSGWVLRTLVIGFAILALVQSFLFRLFAIPSSSMQNTLQPRDRVVVDLLAYDSATPARGDIVVFRHGDTWDATRRPPSSSSLVNAARNVGDLLGIRPSNYTHTVKRVVAVGGDTISCCDNAGRVMLNGQALDEPYIFEDIAFTAGTLDCATQPSSARCFGPIRVPEGELLMVGDHRSNSADSVSGCRGARGAVGCARLVPGARITGKVIAKAWPPGPVG